MIQKYNCRPWQAAQHTSKELLKFILPDDTVIVDLEVMTLTGVHVYREDRNSVEK